MYNNMRRTMCTCKSISLPLLLISESALFNPSICR